MKVDFYVLIWWTKKILFSPTWDCNIFLSALIAWSVLCSISRLLTNTFIFLGLWTRKCAFLDRWRVALSVAVWIDIGGYAIEVNKSYTITFLQSRISKFLYRERISRWLLHGCSLDLSLSREINKEMQIDELMKNRSLKTWTDSNIHSSALECNFFSRSKFFFWGGFLSKFEHKAVTIWFMIFTTRQLCLAYLAIERKNRPLMIQLLTFGKPAPFLGSQNRSIGQSRDQICKWSFFPCRNIRGGSFDSWFLSIEVNGHFPWANADNIIKCGLPFSR